MKFAILFWFIGLSLLTACTNNTRPSKETVNDTSAVENMEEIAEAPQLQSQFPDLYAYFQKQDTTFRSGQFEGGELETTDSLPNHPVDRSHLLPYYPFLVFNADSSKAVDFVSYNYVLSRKNGKNYIEQGGPDTEVALIDFKEGFRKRLLFLGAAGTVLDAKWENDHVVLLAGAEEVDAENIKPTLWRYDLHNNRMEWYSYTGRIQAHIHDYTEEKLNARLKTSPSF